MAAAPGVNSVSDRNKRKVGPLYLGSDAAETRMAAAPGGVADAQHETTFERNSRIAAEVGSAGNDDGHVNQIGMDPELQISWLASMGFDRERVRQCVWCQRVFPCRCVCVCVCVCERERER
jgi:hypothetical protein